jgi:hypothetical protein
MDPKEGDRSREEGLVRDRAVKMLAPALIKLEETRSQH